MLQKASSHRRPVPGSKRPSALPESFLEVLTHRLEPSPGLVALCAGFELGEWRSEAFSAYLINYLLDFALTPAEAAAVRSHNTAPAMRRAAQMMYTTPNAKKRGEFGELLLHAVLRQVFDSDPAISKIYFKDSSNDTVKGFDAVHVVGAGDELELWLGEAKFYSDAKEAIREVVAELQVHLRGDYLRREFIAIGHKIDSSTKHTALRRLISPNTTLDEVFRRICVPVLITYDSKTVNRFVESTEEYRREIVAEVAKVHEHFLQSGIPTCVRIHLLLVPLGDKTKLVEALDKRLRACQKM